MSLRLPSPQASDVIMEDEEAGPSELHSNVRLGVPSSSTKHKAPASKHPEDEKPSPQARLAELPVEGEDEETMARVKSRAGTKGFGPTMAMLDGAALHACRSHVLVFLAHSSR